MIIVRPAALSDQPGIEKLILEAEAPVSSLPQEREYLAKRIQQSIESFANDNDSPGLDRFLFVLFDEKNSEVLGTAGLSAVAGSEGPFYNYRIDEVIHASKAHGVYNPVQMLSLSHDLSNTTLLSSFTLARRLRESEYRDLLSRARLMFMALSRSRFQKRCIAELQGVVRNDDRYSGTSPFWENVGRHFFDIDYTEADQHVMTRGKTFIAELMPPYPLYLPMLHDDARAVIGLPHDRVRPNMRFLQKQGFELSHYVDIFDAGPVLEIKTDKLLAGQRIVTKQARMTSSSHSYAEGGSMIAMNDRPEEFRAALVNLTEGMGDLQRIRQSDAEALHLQEGETMHYSRLRPGQGITDAI